MPVDEEYSRIEAIWALAGSDSAGVEAELLCAVHDSNPQVRRAALTVLGGRYDSDYDGLFQSALDDEDMDVRKVAAEHLIQLGSDDACLAAVRSLRKSGRPEDVLLLVTALHSEFDEVRDAAARALVFLKDLGCVGPLLSLVGNGSYGLEARMKAASVLGNFDLPKVLDGLAALLADDFLWRAAASALGGSSSPYACDLLLEALCREGRDLQLAAAHGIRANGDIRALHQLCGMLEGSDPIVRMYAANALAGLAEKLKAGEGETAAEEPLSAKVMSVAIPPLTLACRDADEWVRHRAVAALGAIGAPQSASYIVEALHDPSDWVFFAAAGAAAGMKISRAMDVILEQFAGDLPEDFDCRLSYAVASLVTLGDRRACAFLARCAESPYWSTRVEAAHALLTLGNPRGWEILVRALGERDEDWHHCRAEIARTIAGSRDPRAVEVLLAAMQGIDVDYDSDQRLLVAIIQGLGEFGDRRAAEAIGMWRHFEFPEHEGLVDEALRKLGEP